MKPLSIDSLIFDNIKITKEGIFIAKLLIKGENNMKIKTAVLTKERSKKLQELFFKKGGGWCGNSTHDGFKQNSELFLYIDIERMTLLWRSNHGYFVKNDQYREVSYPEAIQIINAISDAEIKLPFKTGDSILRCAGSGWTHDIFSWVDMEKGHFRTVNGNPSSIASLGSVDNIGPGCQPKEHYSIENGQIKLWKKLGHSTMKILSEHFGFDEEFTEIP